MSQRTTATRNSGESASSAAWTCGSGACRVHLLRARGRARQPLGVFRQRIRFDPLPEDTERLPGTAPSPEQVYADTHLDPQVQAALDALSPEFRVAVVLCDIEGLTYEEIAATLGIKLGTVRSRIHRGRVQLREALAHLDPRRAEAIPA